MSIRSPEISLEQISGWLRRAAEPTAAAIEAPPRPVMKGPAERNHPGFDFKKVKQSLNRARGKNEVKTLQPFRRLRRNQAAVNEGLIDACGALIAVSKQMACEIDALAKDVTNLRRQLAARQHEETR